jgi:hypothetical protein
MSRGRELSAWGLGLIVSFVGAEGCRQSPTSKPTTSQPSASREIPVLPAAPAGQTQSPSTVASGVDAKDAPHSPAYLPKSQAAAGWTKREPIRVYPANNLTGAMTKDDAARCGYFKIRSASKCAYDLTGANGKAQLARVLAVDTESAEDAYGLLSCRLPATETFKIGGETRVDRRDGLHLHCWQGKSYIRVDLAEGGAEITEQAIRLLLNITGRIAKEDLPALVSAAPSDSSGLQRKWLLRHLGSLPPKAFDLAFPLDASKTNGLLGLDKSTLMCIAQYEVPQGARSNVVWVVRYPNTKAAYDAHARYTRFLADRKDPAAQSTNLLPPHGPYLIGTWTAEEESIQYVMPTIGKLLPS